MGEKINIWGSVVPYNTGKSKLEDMPVIHKDWTMKDIFMAKENNIFEKDGDMNEADVLDTHVYIEQMATGVCSMNYDDVPYLEAYVVEGSKYCVLDVPGGAYITVSMDNEGTDVAKTLNAQGISVFVLRYRTYPYKAPVMFADCQRAIKWLMANSEKYGYDKDKISMIGYSAGGNLVGTTYNLFMNENLLPSDYVKDDIDNIQPKVVSLGLVYPKLMFTNSSKILAAVTGVEALKDENKRAELIDKYTLHTKINESHVPTFIVNATDDELIPSEDVLTYAVELQKNKVPFEMHLYGRGGHGFGGCLAEPHPMFKKDREGVETWMTLYSIWLKKLVDKL